MNIDTKELFIFNLNNVPGEFVRQVTDIGTRHVQGCFEYNFIKSRDLNHR